VGLTPILTHFRRSSQKWSGIMCSLGEYLGSIEFCQDPVRQLSRKTPTRALFTRERC
jgi:hypothetical protein